VRVMRRHEPWPNTQLWQRTESALRSMYDSAWRRRGEALMGVGRGDLRKLIDGPVSDQLAARIENIVFTALRAHAAVLRDEAVASAKRYEEFAYACSDRRHLVKESRRERMIREWCEQGHHPRNGGRVKWS
jgi:hypothetical protein